MWKTIIKNNITGVLIGVIGLVSALVTLLIGTDLNNININVRWFIVSFVVFFSIIAIMLKMIVKYDSTLKNWEDINNEYYVKTYSVVHKNYVIRSERKIPINTIMSVFFEDEGLEIPAGLCRFVNNSSSTYMIEINYFATFVEKYSSIITELEVGNKAKISKLKVKNFIVSE